MCVRLYMCHVIQIIIVIIIIIVIVITPRPFAKRSVITRERAPTSRSFQPSFEKRSAQNVTHECAHHFGHWNRPSFTP